MPIGPDLIDPDGRPQLYQRRIPAALDPPPPASARPAWPTWLLLIGYGVLLLLGAYLLGLGGMR